MAVLGRLAGQDDASAVPNVGAWFHQQVDLAYLAIRTAASVLTSATILQMEQVLAQTKVVHACRVRGRAPYESAGDHS